jgi:hypothetical protein
MSTDAVSPGAWIDGVGLIAPGMPDWPTAVEVMAGRQAYTPAPSVLPAPAWLPPAERRRASRVVRVALALGQQAVAQAGADPGTLATVFAASGADGHNCHALCEQLAGEDRQISPTRFHNSVHNAAAGYWGIATRCMAPSQVVCAYDGSFGAGLLDALAQVLTEERPVLLIAYDSEYPQPLHAVRPVPDAAGVAWLLSPRRSPRSLAWLGVRPAPADAMPEVAAPAELEPLRQQFPSLCALPILGRLARGQAGAAVVRYLPGQALALEVQPC